MRSGQWKIFAVGAVVASLGLAACGVKASMDQAISSLGASPDVQVHLTGSVSGPDSSQAQAALNVLTMDMRYSSASGAALSQSKGNVNSEVDVNVGSQSFVEVRQIDSNLYLLVNVSALSDIPGVNLSQAEISTLQLTLGGRWFEFPKSLIDTYLPTSAKVKAQAAKDQGAEQKILDEVSSVIEATSYTTLPGGGYSQTGSLESIVKAVLPTVETLSGHQIHPSAVKGSYTIGVTMSGVTATGGSIEITAPDGTSGDQSISLHATVAHAALSVAVPAGATVITPALLKGLLAQA